MSVNEPIKNCTITCPAAIREESPQLWVISLLYLAMALFTLFELVYGILWRLGSKYFSTWLRHVLIATCMVFSLMRGTQFLIPFEYTLFSLVSMNYILPLTIQFVIYSEMALVLLLYLLRIKESYKPKYGYIVYGIYCAFVVVLVSSSFVASYLIAVDKASTNSDDEHQPFDHGFTVWAAVWFVFFFFLAAALFRMTYRSLRRIAMSHRKRIELLRFGSLSGIYFLMFFMRVVWDILYAFHANPLQEWINTLVDPNSPNQCRESYYSALLCFYLIMEYLPMLVLIISLHFMYSHATNEKKKPVFTTSAATSTPTPNDESWRRFQSNAEESKNLMDASREQNVRSYQ